MTRFARGGPANKKKPHDATEWKNMFSHVEKKDKSKNGGHKSLKSNKALTTSHKSKRKIKIKPKVSGNIGLDVKNEMGKTEDAVSYLTSTHTTSTGLATELENLSHVNVKCKESTNLSGMIDNSKDVVKGLGEKNVKRKKGKFLKTELSDYLSGLKGDKLLNEDDRREVGELLKKDQRRERRRLKRIDKKAEGKICFNCRQSGHTVADCPKKMEHEGQGSGICFKCGSTEHSMNKCKVRLPPGRYPYAKCFICDEQGHLSSQCPDNPRGLYPNGGCCGTCSSVEHFKKDCPELQKQQGISSFAVERMSSSFENIEREISLERKFNVQKPKNKIVRF